MKYDLTAGAIVSKQTLNCLTPQTRTLSSAVRVLRHIIQHVCEYLHLLLRKSKVAQ